MAQLFEIKKVTVGPRNLSAVVEVAPDAPLYTDEDLIGTTLIYNIMPAIADHLCLGDASESFGDVMGATELAHLLEHVTVELLARTDIAGDIACGQTIQVGERTYQLTFPCSDDVLVAGALSSAVWIMQWAFTGGGDPEPNVDATADGLVALVQSLSESPAEDETGYDDEIEVPAVEEVVPDDSQDVAPEAAPEPEIPEYPLDEPYVDQSDLDEPDLDEPEPNSEPEPAAEAPDAYDSWGMGNVPRPRPVR